jgi:hypothetical protein
MNSLNKPMIVVNLNISASKKNLTKPYIWLNLTSGKNNLMKKNEVNIINYFLVSDILRDGSSTKKTKKK